MMILRNLVFICLISCFFTSSADGTTDSFNGTKSLSVKSSSSKKFLSVAQKERFLSLPVFDRNIPMAKGIIIRFHRWPGKEERDAILKELEKSDLEKKSEIQRFNIWIFEWPNLQKKAKAKKLCETVSSLPSLKYCQPDLLINPAVQGGSQEKKQEIMSQGGTEYIMLRAWASNRNLDFPELMNVVDNMYEETVFYIDNPEAPSLLAEGKSYSPTVPAIINNKLNRDRLEYYFSIKKEATKAQSSEKPLNTNPQTNINPDDRGDLRSCNIISSQKGLFKDRLSNKAQLSDYWAQELVGTDLLREELEKAPSIRKNLVEVFDVPYQKASLGHDVGVRNLVSDEGPHAVLPELEDNVGITHTPFSSSAVRAADRLLKKVEDICTETLKDSDKSPQSLAHRFF